MANLDDKETYFGNFVNFETVFLKFFTFLRNLSQIGVDAGNEIGDIDSKNTLFSQSTN